MSLLLLEFSRRKPSRKFSLKPAILLLGVLMFASVLVPRPVHAVGTSNCTPTPDFRVELSTQHFYIGPSTTATSTITATPINGFTGSVNLAAVNVPSEILNPSLNPATLDLATGSKTATLTFSSSSTIGEYFFDVNATTSGTLYHTGIIHVRVLGPEIGVSADKFTVPLQQGASDTATITLKSLIGFAGTVDLSTSIVALGFFHVYTPPTASSSTSSISLGNGVTKTATLTISASMPATPGLYSVSVTATSNNPTATNATSVFVEVLGPDFAIGVKDSTMILPLGTSTPVSLDVNSTMSFTGPVALSVDITAFIGTPPTATLSSQTVTLTAGEHSVDIVTFTAGTGTTPGFYLANITGTSGGNLAHYELVSIDVPEGQTRGFSLTPNPDTLSVDRAGASASSIITIKSDNLADTIDLSISCYPEEITASLSESSVTLTSGQSVTSTLTVSASQYTTPGEYEVAIYGDGVTSAVTNQTFVTVTVTGPDFSLNSNPASLSIVQGSTGTTTISMTSLQGFTSNVALSAVPIAPSGLTSALDTTPISPSQTSTLTVHVTNTTPVGTYMIIVTGTSGNLIHTLQIAVAVTASSPQPDFQISATSPVSFSSGSTGISTITLSPLNYFYAPVVLTATVVPQTGLAVSFSPSTVPYGNSPSTATFSSSTAGSYSVTVTGTSGSLTHSTTVQVTVTSPGTPDFDVTTSQNSLSINSGDKGTTTINVTPKYGFTGNVALTHSVAPSGPTASLSSSSVNGGSGSVTLTIDVGSNVGAGTYIVTVQGSSGSLAHSVQVTISVTSPQSQQTSSNPQTILGLAPNLFYILVGGIAVVVAGVGVAVKLRKPKPQ